MSNATANATATSSIPSDSPGCWGNSDAAVSACCSVFGGVRIPLADSPIAACGYNVGDNFMADDGSVSESMSDPNSTTSRWASCITQHFNATADGTEIISTCQNNQSLIATVTSSPASTTGTSGAQDLFVFRRQGHWAGRGVLAAIVVGSGLLHLLSLAI
ncbi:hypothetical protein K438DRAFT_1965698 [Mycena galopus ATCC 62051]|nr:hypothetical protein K438DRAFT_1965698 [Mycena galopus ATCC 62051]